MSNPLDRLHPKVQWVDLKTGLLTPFAFKWLVQNYNRLGGQNDAISDVQNGEVYETGTVDSRLTNLLNDFQDYQVEQDTKSDSRISDLYNRLEELQNEFDASPIWITPTYQDYQKIYTSTAFTTTGKQIVVVTSNVTITLNAKPIDGEVAIIKRVTTAGEVTISAGSNTIDGSTTHTLLVNYECAQCMYSYAASEWLII